MHHSIDLSILLSIWDHLKIYRKSHRIKWKILHETSRRSSVCSTCAIKEIQLLASWSSLLISGSTSSSVLGCSSVTGSHSGFCIPGRNGRNFLDIKTLLTTNLTDAFWPEFSISKNPATAIHCIQTRLHFKNTVAGLSIRNNLFCYFQIGLGFDSFWLAHSFVARLEVMIGFRTAKAGHHVICCQHLGTLLVVYINYVGSWREIRLILVQGKFVSQASTNRDAVSQARQRHEWLALKHCRKT